MGDALADDDLFDIALGLPGFPAVLGVVLHDTLACAGDGQYAVAGQRPLHTCAAFAAGRDCDAVECCAAGDACVFATGGVPLLLRAVKVDGGQLLIIGKGILADRSHATGDGHGGQAGKAVRLGKLCPAVSKGLLSNGGHTVGDGHGGQPLAIRESFLTDAFQSRLQRQLRQIAVDVDTVVPNGRYAAGDCQAGDVGVLKGVAADTGHAVADLNAADHGAGIGPRGRVSSAA